MQWQRSEDLTTPHQTPKSIPDSESVRLAALQASWRRDRRVAQRRIVWRWIAWYSQRYAPHALAGVVVLSGAAYFSGIRLHGLIGSNDVPPSVQEAPRHYTPPSVPAAPVVADQVLEAPTPVAADADTPLVLRNSLSLETRTAGPAPVAEASADTLSLKPENWLHSKEP